MRYLVALIVMFFIIGQADACDSYELRVIVSKQDAYIADMESIIETYAFQLAMLRVQKDYAEDQLITSISDGVK